jgi:hypothetical protein
MIGLNSSSSTYAVSIGTAAGEDFHISLLFQVSNKDVPASCSAQIFKLLSISGFTASTPVKLLASSGMLPKASS